jgi:hypothetical protein
MVDVNILEIKKILYNKYNLYIKKYETKLYDIFILQGKITLTEQLKMKTISLETFIFNENYYITNLDLQIVLEYYKIPSVLLSNKLLLETNYNSNFLIINDNETNPENITLINYIFIVSTPPKPENVPNYKLLISKNDINHIQFNLRNFNEFIKLNILENYKENNINVELFISNYKKEKKTKYIPKKIGVRKNLVYDDDDYENDEIQPAIEPVIEPEPAVQPVVQSEIKNQNLLINPNLDIDLSDEEFIIIPKKKQKKTKKIVGKKTKKNKI